MTHTRDLTEGPVGKTLWNLTLPMIAGFFSMIAFNLVDTIFVAQLGTDPLAAMSFTFPVIFFLAGMMVGLGTGTASVISRAVGAGDADRARRLTTDAILLGFVWAIVISVLGLLTIDPLFSLMGASPPIIALIGQYMSILFGGIFVFIVPVLGNHSMRGYGDTLTPSIIMMGAAVINALLDPVLIYGLFGLPRMELAGAALATIIARSTSLVAAIWVLHWKKHMLVRVRPRLRAAWDSWRPILIVAVPAALANLSVPLSMAVITNLASRFGPGAVAAVGTGIRLENMALMVVLALAAAVIPFIGQNYGAGRPDRVRGGYFFSARFSVYYGLVIWALFFVLAHPIAGLFSDDPEVVGYIVWFVRIMPGGYPLLGIGHVTIAAFNSINRPIHAAMINLVRMFFLAVPLAYLGARLFSVPGIFCGMALANIISGVGAFLLFRWMSRRKRL
ncbi:MAG: MATE family efflux transporter [Deltaproteobacteria bacterium]|nr:MATE family efflux transporter [Candidatus Zymogenaceae bacterium]